MALLKDVESGVIRRYATLSFGFFVMWCRDDAQGVLLDVLVQPRASREQVGPVQGDRLKLAVQAPPVEGAANAAVVRLLAQTLDLRRADISIRAGHRGRRKTVHIAGLDAATLQKKVLR